MSEKKLFTEFPPVSTEQWESVINADLKGADYEKKLVWKTGEGFNAKPYYRAEDLNGLEYLKTVPGEFPYVRGNKPDSNNWEIRHEIKVTCTKEANAVALDALAKGADAVGFSISPKSKETSVDVDNLIQGINISVNPVWFDAGINASGIMNCLKNKKDIKGGIFFDPFGRLACSGSYYGCKSFPSEIIKSLVEQSSFMPGFRVIGVDGSMFQNAGSTMVQELAFALSMGNEYVSVLKDSGLNIADVVGKMVFRFAVGSNYFMEMAKFRAARYLWAKILEAWGPELKSKASMYIHGVTATWNMTGFDAYVNLLRTTTEAMSAALGGVNAISVLPFDSAYKAPDAFSERIARNQQIVLKEEAYMDKIADPAAGSYYIENLTDSIIKSAWVLFIEIQNKGGFLKSLESGYIQGLVEESAKSKRDALAKRKQILLGTNQYANAAETMSDKIEMPAIGTCCTFGEDAIVKTIRPFRLAESFEELRLKTEKSGKRPKVFLLTIGNLAMRKARAGFALNFFAVAGFEVIDNNGFSSVKEGVEAAVKAKADIIVLCSSDDEYPVYAPEAIQEIGGKSVFVLAGYPKAIIDELKAAGVENFIYAGQNVLESLQSYQSKLGI